MASGKCGYRGAINEIPIWFDKLTANGHSESCIVQLQQLIYMNLNLKAFDERFSSRLRKKASWLSLVAKVFGIHRRSAGVGVTS